MNIFMYCFSKESIPALYNYHKPSTKLVMDLCFTLEM